MPRPLRCYSRSDVYHIILKGIDNQDIFYDNRDRNFFLEQVAITKKEYDYAVYAYCLMDNHVHMVIKNHKEFLSKSIQSLMVRYVHHFNRKYGRVGPLVQNRFKSKNVEDQRYFIDVCKYVHRNPENAGICKTQDYEWSSYKEYIGEAKIVNKDILLHYFNNDVHEFVKYTNNIDETENVNEFAEYELIEKLTDEQLANIIMKKFKIKDVGLIADFFKLKTKDELKADLLELKKIKGTNVTQAARVIRLGRAVIKNVW